MFGETTIIGVVGTTRRALDILLESSFGRRVIDLFRAWEGSTLAEVVNFSDWLRDDSRRSSCMLHIIVEVTQSYVHVLYSSDGNIFSQLWIE